MTCVRVPFAGGAILTLSDESEPFFYRGRRFVVSKQWGPFAANRHGDPLKSQPSGRMLQGAYEHWKAAQVKP